jgi:hypothetical protein
MFKSQPTIAWSKAASIHGQLFGYGIWVCQQNFAA